MRVLSVACRSLHHVCAWCLWAPEDIDCILWSCRWLWAIIWVLGIEPGSPGRVTSALNPWLNSPVLNTLSFSFYLFLFTEIVNLLSVLHVFPFCLGLFVYGTLWCRIEDFFFLNLCLHFSHYDLWIVMLKKLSDQILFFSRGWGGRHLSRQDFFVKQFWLS